MTKNPFVNALLAVLYIILIATILYYGTIFKVGNNSLLAPITMISLFSISAVMMGLIFIYQPFILYFDGKKKPAIKLFLNTVVFFAAFTIIFLSVLFIFSGRR